LGEHGVIGGAPIITPGGSRKGKESLGTKNSGNAFDYGNLRISMAKRGRAHGTL